MLCIQLNRNSHVDAYRRIQKVQKPIKFEDLLTEKDYFICKKGVEYLLTGFIEHYGNADEGHYVAYRKLDYSQNKPIWIYASDSDVTKQREDLVFEAEAYMLFYVQ